MEASWSYCPWTCGVVAPGPACALIILSAIMMELQYRDDDAARAKFDKGACTCGSNLGSGRINAPAPS